jgi:putative ABC transport system permease protein
VEDVKDILRQLLVEAAVLCLGGSSIEIFVGFGNSERVGLLTGWPTQASAGAVAVVGLVTVGITFGYYPAREASQLNPTDGLRYV